MRKRSIVYYPLLKKYARILSFEDNQMIEINILKDNTKKYVNQKDIVKCSGMRTIWENFKRVLPDGENDLPLNTITFICKFTALGVCSIGGYFHTYPGPWHRIVFLGVILFVSTIYFRYFFADD